MDEPIDISAVIRSGMVAYEGDTPVSVRLISSLAAGDEAEVSTITLSAHAGTHIDAPSHFIAGAGGAESVPLDVLRGPVVVVDATGVADRIDAETLLALDVPPGKSRLIFKTRNSALWDSPVFDPGYVGLTADAAAVLVESGIELVGIDYLSVSVYGEAAPVHRTLLGAGVVILEGLDLRAAPPGLYELLCLPLRLEGTEAAPARALLVRR